MPRFNIKLPEFSILNPHPTTHGYWLQNGNIPFSVPQRLDVEIQSRRQRCEVLYPPVGVDPLILIRLEPLRILTV
jgi:hypothetical protein